LLPDPVSAYLSNNSYDLDSIPAGFCLLPEEEVGIKMVMNKLSVDIRTRDLLHILELISITRHGYKAIPISVTHG
jgi:hypothetical protein